MTENTDSLPDPMMAMEIVGPFEDRRVVLEGYQVPFLQAQEVSSTLSLTLDGRFGLDIPVELSEPVVYFIAQAIAVGLGYACHAGPPRPVFRRLAEITSVEMDDVDDD